MTEDFKTLAAQLRDLQDATKAQIAGVMSRAEEAGLDPAGLRRFVSWRRKDEAKRAQQEAIDQQCRYLAGERDTPAQLPIGCELAQALNLYRRGLTVRQVAEELHVSTGKAGKLKQLSRMFDVHVHATVDKAPPHNPITGEITPPVEMGAEPKAEHATESISVLSGRGERSDEISKPRSPAFTTSDSTAAVEPVVPTGNEGRAGERGTSSEQEAPAAMEGDYAQVQVAGNTDGACRDEAGETRGRDAAGVPHGSGARGGEAGSVADAGAGAERRQPDGRCASQGAAAVRVEPSPPLGAVTEGDSPQRVADPNPTSAKNAQVGDGLDIPSFLRRNGLATAQTPSHPDEREKAAT